MKEMNTASGSARSRGPGAMYPATPRSSGLSAREPDATYLAPKPKRPAWSDASVALFAALGRPAELRPLAPFRRDFVDRYVPNESSLLPPELAHQLHRAAAWNETLKRGAFGRAVREPFVIDLAWSSSLLEGNTFTRQDTESLFALSPLLLQGGGAAHGEEIQMLINHKSAIEHLLNCAPNSNLCMELVFAVHDRLMDGLLDDVADQGRVRRHAIEIRGSVFEPEQDSAALNELLEQILEKGAAVRNPVEAAFFLWVSLAYLQAFADGNKRTSRLMANVPLLLHNCAPISFEGITELEYGLAMVGVHERNDLSAAIDVFAFTYRRSMQKYVAMMANRPLPDPRAMRYRAQLRRVMKAVVIDRKSVAAAIVQEWMSPCDAAELAELVAERLPVLQADSGPRYELDSARIDAWIAAGRPY